MDVDMDFNMDTVNTLHRKDTTKGPPLRVLSLGMDPSLSPCPV